MRRKDLTIEEITQGEWNRLRRKESLPQREGADLKFGIIINPLIYNDFVSIFYAVLSSEEDIQTFSYKRANGHRTRFPHPMLKKFKSGKEKPNLKWLRTEATSVGVKFFNPLGGKRDSIFFKRGPDSRIYLISIRTPYETLHNYNYKGFQDLGIRFIMADYFFNHASE